MNENELEKVADQILSDMTNGVINGFSAGKCGRAWLDGEFCLDELEAICIKIRSKCKEEGTSAIGLKEYMKMEF